MSEILHNAGLVVGYCLFYLVMLAGVAIIPLGVPGQFLIVVAALAWCLVLPEALSLWIVAILLGIAILAELLEAVAGFLGASKARGSIWSSFGALLGGIAGAIVGSLFLPVIGSLIGALVGTFAGAYAVEYYRTRAMTSATHVAKGALIGRIVGSIIKVFLSLVMIVIVTVALL